VFVAVSDEASKADVYNLLSEIVPPEIMEAGKNYFVE
jgi:hypothetical protein